MQHTSVTVVYILREIRSTMVTVFLAPPSPHCHTHPSHPLFSRDFCQTVLAVDTSFDDMDSLQKNNGCV